MADTDRSQRPVHQYDESKIKTLLSLEQVRLRTGVYMGRLGNGAPYDDGGSISVKEVIDNAVDAFIMGYGRQIDLAISGPRVRVRNHGRGTPLGKVVDGVSMINAGAKYNDEVFQFSVGLNEVGAKAVIALSWAFTVRSHRAGELVEATFRQGRLVREEKGRNPGSPDGTLMEFEPDAEVFKDWRFRLEHVERRLRHYSYLNSWPNWSRTGTTNPLVCFHPGRGSRISRWRNSARMAVSGCIRRFTTLRACLGFASPTPKAISARLSIRT
ncbi:MAG: hypothetical protein RMN51_09305 [Verrucomicrobiota bacterium]|nr:hypothetical protein [Limisphaera sp.]MDW8382288.1 hypothetical protein [Verrucomicrobiota bacterium]